MVINYILKNQKITNHIVRAITELKKDGAKKLLQNMVLKELLNSLEKNKGRY